MPGDAPEPMAAAITAEGIQADGAQEPFDQSLAPGPEDACALTLRTQSADFPLLLPSFVLCLASYKFPPSAVALATAVAFSTGVLQRLKRESQAVNNCFTFSYV